MPDGGYDNGYVACSCFWGTQPGSFVVKAAQMYGNLQGTNVLDAGCGEGKNAAYLASLGAAVVAVDISEAALRNAQAAWSHQRNVTWILGDIRERLESKSSLFDVVVAYGLLHCLPSAQSIREVVGRLQAVTRPGGLNVICTFNDRAQDLRAHPGFDPCLLPHQTFVAFYAGWSILEATDSDLIETHPHNGIEHSHSLTRILARCTNG